MKKVRVKVVNVEKGDGYYRVRYCYSDLKVNNRPVYSLRTYDAMDELGAFLKFKRCMQEVNYEVITNE